MVENQKSLQLESIMIPNRFHLFLVLLSLAARLLAQPVQIVGTIRSVDGNPLTGSVDIIEEGPHFRVTPHRVGQSGVFRVSANAQHGIVVTVRPDNHPPDERYIAPGSEGTVNLDFELPLAHDITGRIVDGRGFGVVGATVQARYHEPTRPQRRSAFHDMSSTDGDGFFTLQSIGIDSPFYIDVHAPSHRPATSELIRLTEGNTSVGDIVLGEAGGIVVIQVVDDAGVGVSGAQVILLADPSGYRSRERGSLLHNRGFRQVNRTSQFGNVRFSGVPSGRIFIHARLGTREVQSLAQVDEAERLRIILSIL